MSANENRYQAGLIKRIEARFPGCIVLKNDPDYIQGIPDLLVLFDGKWAALECKRSSTAKHRPNQDYYVERMNSMSFASFIFPENEKRVLDEMESALGSGR
jgi:hypothetical protein